MIPHEKYEPDPDFKNDIALLKLKHAYDNKGNTIIFQSNYDSVFLTNWNSVADTSVTTFLGKQFKANTICLPFDEKPKEKYLDIDVTVAGWGFTQVQGDRSKLLLGFIRNNVL